MTLQNSWSDILVRGNAKKEMQWPPKRLWMFEPERYCVQSCELRISGIGVASYGALGHVPPSTSERLIFQGTNSDIRLHAVAYPIFVPLLLAPGDATDIRHAARVWGARAEQCTVYCISVLYRTDALWLWLKWLTTLITHEYSTNDCTHIRLIIKHTHSRSYSISRFNQSYHLSTLPTITCLTYALQRLTTEPAGAVLAQKFWRGIVPTAPSSPSPFYPFSETEKNTNSI